jgi:hypothetical protein
VKPNAPVLVVPDLRIALANMLANRTMNGSPLHSNTK